MKNYNIKIFISVIAAAFIFPAAISDVLYRDDAYRLSISGGYWWWMGRPLADLVAWITSNDTSAIINSHPAGLLISTAVFVCVLFYIIDSKLIIDRAYALAPLPLLLASPFFIQNISYQYDAPGMILGLTFGIASFFALSLNSGLSYPVSFACLFVSLSLYQPTANIFIGLSAANLLLNIRSTDKRKIISTIEECFIFCITYIAYYLLIIKLLSFSGSGRGSIVPLQNIITSLLITAHKFFGYCFALLNSVVIAQIIISSAFIMLSLTYGFIKKKFVIRDILLHIVYAIISLAMIFFSSVGVSFLVPEGIAGVRVLVGFSVVYYIIAAVIIKAASDKKPIAIVTAIVIPTLILSYQFFKYSSEQRRYEYSILNSIAKETESFNRIYIVGDMKPSIPVGRAIYEKRALSLFLAPAQPWVYKRLLYSLGATNVEQGWSDKPKAAFDIINSGREIYSNRFYTITEKDDIAAVEIK